MAHLRGLKLRQSEAADKVKKSREPSCSQTSPRGRMLGWSPVTRCLSRVNRVDPAMSVTCPLYPQLLSNWCGAAKRRDVPCVDGSLLARVFFTVQVVGCGHVFGLT